jgi:hypothetical protein
VTWRVLASGCGASPPQSVSSLALLGRALARSPGDVPELFRNT